MNNIKKYTYALGLSVMALTTACSDQSDLLESVNYNRLFSPISLEAKVVNKVNVRLTWTVTTENASYDVEVFADDSLTFEGSPVKTITGITASEIPYVISGLEGETKYSARVKATAEGVQESKWNGVYFKTDAEQSFKKIEESDLQATQVTLRWPAGLTADVITITPGDIKHVLTAEEKAAGAATITGLTGETKYKAVLKNGEKTRGTMEFTTLIDLGGAIALKPEDDFAAAIEAANDGDVFALYPGEYRLAGEEGSTNVGKINLSKSIAFKAVRPNDRPVINGCINLAEGVSLELSQVVLDGTNTDGSQAINITKKATYAKISIEDCEIKNYTKGFYYVNVAATIDELTINNCLIHDIECDGGDLFDCRKGAIKVLNITNSTIYNSCAARDMVRYDDASSAFAGVSPVITISNCTFDAVSNTKGKRLLYVRFKNNSIVFKNNLVTNTAAEFSNQKNTATPTFGNNNYFKADALNVKGASETTLIVDESGSALDPGYKDAASGNFKVSNETIIDKKIGDPRWL